MNNKGALAVFAKTVSLSPVKTRLQGHYDIHTIHAYYQQAVKATESIMYHAHLAHGWRSYWMLPEKQGVQMSCWHGYNTCYSGEGGLGQRLATTYSALQKAHTQVIIIGTDTPHMPHTLFDKVADWLAAYPQECVIGPTVDGGFYLFAASIVLSPCIWTNVNYSTTTTLCELLAQLKNHNIQVHLLPTMTDTDTANDLLQSEQALIHNDHKTKEQECLLQWYEKHLV